MMRSGSAFLILYISLGQGSPDPQDPGSFSDVWQGARPYRK